MCLHVIHVLIPKGSFVFVQATDSQEDHKNVKALIHLDLLLQRVKALEVKVIQV